MDGQRQQYIPAPPPHISQSSAVTHMMPFPPPPPRMPHSGHGLVPPPPPGPPPGTTYTVQPGWQQGWARHQAMAQQFPPPPPPLLSSNQAQNPHLAYSATLSRHQPAPLSIPSRSIGNETHPLTSATYIPGGESFGPGVGIPPLFTHDPQEAYGRPEQYGYPVETESARHVSNPTGNRSYQLNLPLRDHQDPLSPGPPTATLHNPQRDNSGQTKSEYSVGGMTAQEADERWPLNRVLLWLAQNGFSNDWQETFRALDLYGASFVELGSRSDGRRHLSKMHKVVYPQLTKECIKSGTGWDKTREREEGKRMRNLIKKIADQGSSESASIGTRYYDSQMLPSASTDDGLENSPNLGRNSFPSYSSGTAESSPSQQYAARVTPNSAQKQYSGQRPELPIQDSRSDFSRSVFGMLDGRRGHSPSTSSDYGIPLTSEDNPQSGSPAQHFVTMAHQEYVPYSGEANGRSDKRHSSDSMMSRGLSSQGFFGCQGAYRQNDPKKNGQGPSPQEQSARQGLCESLPKEHGKGFFHKLKWKRGTDSMHPSPEEINADSPTSPVGTRYPPPTSVFMKAGFNGSDMSLSERPCSSVSDYDKVQSRPRKVTNNMPQRRFALATPDGWNYRLIDLTDVDAADTLRATICSSLGIKDPGSALIYLTEPGQITHEEPLSDTMLVVNRRTKSDAQATLKFFVHLANLSAASAPVTQPTGLGLSLAERTRLSRNMADDEARNYMGTASPSHRSQSGLKLNTAKSFPYDQFPSQLPPSFGNKDQPSEIDMEGREASLLSAHEEYRREAERKQKIYLQSRQENQPQKDSPKVSIRRDGVIDFDSPRLSPYEDKKTDNLVPLRKPPSAPSESSTLSKVNSLSRKPGDRPIRGHDSTDRAKRSSAEQISEERGEKPWTPTASTASPGLSDGLGAALAGIGKVSSAIGKPFAGQAAASGRSPLSASEPVSGKGRSMQSVDFNSGDGRRSTPSSSPKVPVFGRGKGNTIFTVPQYDAERHTKHPGDTKKPLPAADLDGPSSASPANVNTPSGEKRKSIGPDFDFQETEVSFAKAQVTEDDSDEDSDEGLFAIPLAGAKGGAQSKTVKAPTNNDGGSQSRSAKPALTVNTGFRGAKGMSVSFKSPSPGETSNTPSTRSTDKELGVENGGFNPEIGSSDSPEASRFNRRESFVRDDVWASRPPVEGMIEHLDDYFPDVDLDEPYVGSGVMSPPMSPTAPGPTIGSEPDNQALRSRAAHGTLDSIMTQDSTDTLGSDESTLKAKSTINSVAQRNITRSQGGGLTRMKSIREVAKGAHQIHRNQSITASNAKSGALLRRKSTKMFGAKILQVKPGSRLSEHPVPLPPHPGSQSKLPQRQATFRIIRGQLIGKGTYGRVYLGINADNGEILAVKQVEVSQKAAGYDKDKMKEMVSALNQEIDTMQHLEHPNIVQYLGCERGELSISIYLEYIPGGSIGSCLRKHGKFEESVVKSLTRQVLSGLAYLHDQGILHRDLKADNILLDLDGTCKISDFGISKKTDNIYGNDVTNSMQGSVFWMAPEVVQSQGQGYSAKVDIWSLGCVVLEMFAGRRPWSKEEAIGAIFKLGSLNQAPPIPDDVSMEITPEALAFMYDCFTIDTFERPTAETLLFQHPFCKADPHYNFLDTELHAKIRHVL
ncbi:STE/STE11/BCK1 protein kinase [Blastomyces percursus]|uniref:Mitogen-activated protein kinase kinae kinase bck1 n=1 Tax=Blastomyces percursus TaxID=1658174 RepID=A0A1J9RE19_9EURO|nr:STE/STE11/BCK1 protein kinase [Blastomyces percursus]